MKAKFLGFTALGLMAAIVLTAASQPPGSDGGDKGDKKFGKKGDGPDAKGPPDGKGPPRWELGRILPPFVADQLDLTESQQKQLADLQKDIKAKVLKILTEDQRKQLENLRFPGGPKGDKGGRDGPPPGKDAPPGRDGPPGKDGKGPGKGDRGPKGPPPDRDISEDANYSSELSFEQGSGKRGKCAGGCSSKR